MRFPQPERELFLEQLPGEAWSVPSGVIPNPPGRVPVSPAPGARAPEPSQDSPIVRSGVLSFCGVVIPRFCDSPPVSLYFPPDFTAIPPSLTEPPPIFIADIFSRPRTEFLFGKNVRFSPILLFFHLPASGAATGDGRRRKPLVQTSQP